VLAGVDKLIVRVLATLQLLASVMYFLFFVFALNYGGAAANPGVLPAMFVYSFYGLVSAIFLYSTANFARILALIWHAIFLGVVIVGWFFATKPVQVSSGFTLVFIFSVFSFLYLAITSFAASRKNTSHKVTD